MARGSYSLDPVVFLYLLWRRWIGVQFSTSCKFGLLAWVKSQVSETAPRARGDGPRWRGLFVRRWLLLPAHAGMDPSFAALPGM